jgi:ribulose-bisphosphate carboxylase large chain
VRDLLGVRDRPLLATVIKPVGLSVRQLAVHAADCALAGVDLVKDDHSLADQPAAPFRERVLAVAETIRRAARRRGGRTLYFPNLTGPVDRLAERLEDLREAGVEGALVAPAILGLDTLRSLAESSGLVLLAHPSMTGAFFAPGHGIAPAVFYGELLRAAGADIVNLPLPDGRFAFSRADFDATLARLAAPLGAFGAPLPMLAGGVDEDRLARWLPQAPRDAVFLVGGELYRGGRARERAERLVRVLEGGADARRSRKRPRAGREIAD